MFLQRFLIIYGKHYVFSNVHNLSHLIDDVKKFGSLPNFSSYPFENKLFELKNMIRSGRNPLSQLAKRMLETETEYLNKMNNDPKKPTLKTPLNECPSTFIIFHWGKLHRFLEIEFPDFVVNTSEANRWILLENLSIICVEFIVICNNVTWFYGRELTNTKNYFDLPFPSKVLNIFSSDSNFGPPKIYDSKLLKAKLFKLSSMTRNSDSDSESDDEDQAGFVFIPILHTLK